MSPTFYERFMAFWNISRINKTFQSVLKRFRGFKRGFSGLHKLSDQFHGILEACEGVSRL